jgi:hypothetical protein
VDAEAHHLLDDQALALAKSCQLPLCRRAAQNPPSLKDCATEEGIVREECVLCNG